MIVRNRGVGYIHLLLLVVQPAVLDVVDVLELFAGPELRPNDPSRHLGPGLPLQLHSDSMSVCDFVSHEGTSLQPLLSNCRLSHAMVLFTINELMSTSMSMNKYCG